MSKYLTQTQTAFLFSLYEVSKRDRVPSSAVAHLANTTEAYIERTGRSLLNAGLVRMYRHRGRTTWQLTDAGRDRVTGR